MLLAPHLSKRYFLTAYSPLMHTFGVHGCMHSTDCMHLHSFDCRKRKIPPSSNDPWMPAVWKGQERVLLDVHVFGLFCFDPVFSLSKNTACLDSLDPDGRPDATEFCTIKLVPRVAAHVQAVGHPGTLLTTFHHPSIPYQLTSSRMDRGVLMVLSSHHLSNSPDCQ